MNVFDKRPLSLILCVMLGAFVVFSTENPVLRGILLSIFVIVFILTFIKPIAAKINVILTRIIVVFALVAMLLSHVYFDLWFYADKRFEEDAIISGKIEEMNNVSGYTELLIVTDDINDESFTSAYKIKAYVDTNEYYNFSIGSKIKLTGKIEPSDSTDDNKYNASLGISGIIKEVTALEILEYGDFPLSYHFTSFREKISRYIVSISDEKSGGLLGAVLIGEKSYLLPQIKLDFSRIGISHVLALSGMHLAILVIGLSSLITKIAGKKLGNIFTIIFTLAYIILTGFPITVIRAGIMLIISSLLFLLSSTRDSFTSLCVSVFVICLFQPFAIFDSGLWLSAFATSGIIILSEMQSEVYEPTSIPKALKTAFFSSIFAISATFAITALNFQTFSLPSLLSTLVFSVLVEIFLYIGTLLLIFGSFIPIKIILIFLGELITSAAAFLSDVDFLYVSTDFTIVKILTTIFTILFFAFFILKIKHKKTYISVICATLVIIIGAASVFTASERNKSRVDYVSEEKSEYIISANSGVTAVTDISNYTATTSYKAYEVIKEYKYTSIDKYFFIHYTSSLPDAVDMILSKIRIKETYVPSPQNSAEENIYTLVSEICQKYRTKLIILTTDDNISMGDYKLRLWHTAPLGQEKKELLTVYAKEKHHTYITLGMLDEQTKGMTLKIIDGSHAIIFGRHADIGEYKFTYKIEKAQILVFANPNMNIHSSTLEYYSGRTIYSLPQKVEFIR